MHAKVYHRNSDDQSQILDSDYGPRNPQSLSPQRINQEQEESKATTNLRDRREQQAQKLNFYPKLPQSNDAPGSVLMKNCEAVLA